MAQVTVDSLAQNIATTIETQLGVSGKTLQAKLRRAGRLLPKHVRKDADLIVQAQPLADNPKLMKQVNLPRLEAAERRVLAYLRQIDPADRRWGKFLGVMGGLSFNILAAIALFIGVLVWRGLV